jgi:hypothetical protein
MNDFLCFRCKKEKTRYFGLPCSKCLSNKRYQKELEEFNKKYRMGKWLAGRFKEAVAFGYDRNTGRPWAIGKRGEKFDPMQTRYAQYPNDRFGWRATGKIKPKRKIII